MPLTEYTAVLRTNDRPTHACEQCIEYQLDILTDKITVYDNGLYFEEDRVL